MFGAVYRGVSWIGVSCQGAILAGARFEDVDLRFVDFQGANLWGAIFIRCDLRGVTFAYAQLSSARFIGCSFSEDAFEFAATDKLVVSELKPYRGLLSELNAHSIRYVKARDYLYAVYCWGERSRPDEERVKQRTEERVSDVPLVLLHGQTGHALDYLPLALKLQSRPVYAIQLLGHGETSALPLELENKFDDDLFLIEREAPRYLDVVSDVSEVIGALMQKSAGADVGAGVSTEGDAADAGQHEFDLLGYSMGGRLALHIAAHLERVTSSGALKHLALRRLSVIGASLGLSDKARRIERRQQDRAWSDPLWESDEVAPFLTAWQRQPLLARLSERAPMVARRLADHRAQHSPQGLALAFDSLGLAEMPPLADSLPALKTPIWWIYGEVDDKYRAIAERVSALHELSQCLEIPGCGHSPHLEDIEAFWEVSQELFCP